MKTELALLILLAAPCGAAAPRRVVVIGLDGLDWGIVRPLAAQGRLPNLSRLIAEASTGTMHVPPPLRSPAIWTTVATGVSAETHGIWDFSTEGRRTSSSDRRATALWEALSDSSGTVAVVGWLATWPAEAVRGRIVSDQALNVGVREGRVFPADALAGFPTWAAWDAYGADSTERLLRFLPFRWDSAYKKRYPKDSPEYRRNDLIRTRLGLVYMRDESHTRMLEYFLKSRPTLAMIHLWGADHVCHAYWREAFGDASPDERRDFGSVIAKYYEYLDEVVGRLRRAAGPDALLITLSDHGFEAEAVHPGEPAPELSGNHRPDAVLMIAGPGVRRGASLDAPRVLDVAPTILRYLDIPPPPGQTGRPLDEAFEAGALPEARAPRASSRPARSEKPSGLTPEEIGRLKALGYLR